MTLKLFVVLTLLATVVTSKPIKPVYVSPIQITALICEEGTKVEALFSNEPSQTIIVATKSKNYTRSLTSINHDGETIFNVPFIDRADLDLVSAFSFKSQYYLAYSTTQPGQSSHWIIYDASKGSYIRHEFKDAAILDSVFDSTTSYLYFIIENRPRYQLQLVQYNPGLHSLVHTDLNLTSGEFTYANGDVSILGIQPSDTYYNIVWLTYYKGVVLSNSQIILPGNELAVLHSTYEKGTQIVLFKSGQQLIKIILQGIKILSVRAIQDQANPLWAITNPTGSSYDYIFSTEKAVYAHDAKDTLKQISVLETGALAPYATLSSNKKKTLLVVTGDTCIGGELPVYFFSWDRFFVTK